MTRPTATTPLPESRANEPDAKVPGLSLRRGKKGSAWYLYYRTKTGWQRRPKLGNASIMTRTQARQQAREWLVRVARGEDPASDHTRHGRTVQDVIDRFKAEHMPHVKPSTWRMYEHLLDNRIAPKLGKLSLEDVTRDDIAHLHLSMKDTPYQANRMLAVAHKAFAMAVDDWGWMDTNPVRVRRFKEHQRRRYPQPEEAAGLIAAMDVMRPDYPYFIALVELLILTGCRVNEIMSAKWEWIKGDGLHLPDSKGGWKNVPLNSYARDVLAEIPRQVDNPHIICGRRTGDHLKSPKGMWSDLLNKAGITDLRMHDLRRYFASVALSRGLALETVGQLLGHKHYQTTKRYAFLMTDAAGEASQVVGDAMFQSTPACSGRQSSRGITAQEESQLRASA